MRECCSALIRVLAQSKQSIKVIMASLRKEQEKTKKNREKYFKWQ